MSNHTEPCKDTELEGHTRQRSEIAEAVERLKSATVSAADKRSRLPQPLFWSLFASEIANIKKKKSLKRTVDALLGDGGEG